MSGIERWRARLGTSRAIVLACLARMLVAVVPFRFWRNSLGPGSHARECSSEDNRMVRRLAAQVERAAWRLPFEVKCLPQAMALSWMLRRRRIEHRIIFAARPLGLRGADETLHARIECNGAVILGDLPGPWVDIHAGGHWPA